MPARQLRPKLLPEERRIRPGETEGAALVEERADEALPFRQLLDLVEKDRRMRGRQLIDHSKQRREVLGRQCVQARVLDIPQTDFEMLRAVRGSSAFFRRGNGSG